jgi:hypothetical protein
MIHADLQGRTHVPEDVHTSNCLGLLHLLPDSNIIEFLSEAETLRGMRIDLSRYDHVERLKFWPWLSEGGEPDVIVELQEKEGGEGLVLIIEAKHGAGLSSYDQLARYWRTASRRFRHTAVIYLTHDRSLPKADIAASLCEVGSEAPIFWLSWFHLYRWVTTRLGKMNTLPISEQRILNMLRKYLSAQGYLCFLGWSLPVVCSNCQLSYSHAYATGHTIMDGKPQMSGYAHSYGMNRKLILASRLCFYRTRQEKP